MSLGRAESWGTCAHCQKNIDHVETLKHSVLEQIPCVLCCFLEETYKCDHLRENYIFIPEHVVWKWEVTRQIHSWKQDENKKTNDASKGWLCSREIYHDQQKSEEQNDQVMRSHFSHAKSLILCTKFQCKNLSDVVQSVNWQWKMLCLLWVQSMFSVSGFSDKIRRPLLEKLKVTRCRKFSESYVDQWHSLQKVFPCCIWTSKYFSEKKTIFSLCDVQPGACALTHVLKKKHVNWHASTSIKVFPSFAWLTSPKLSYCVEKWRRQMSLPLNKQRLFFSFFQCIEILPCWLVQQCAFLTSSIAIVSGNKKWCSGQQCFQCPREQQFFIPTDHTYIIHTSSSLFKQEDNSFFSAGKSKSPESKSSFAYPEPTKAN